MMKWGKKTLGILFCALLMILGITGCGGQSEKFTGNTWVYVQKTDDGNADFIDILTFEKNDKNYTSKETKTVYKVKYDGMMNEFGKMVYQKYKVVIEDKKVKPDFGMIFDEKSNSLTQNGIQLYTYVSKDDSVVDQNRRYVFKKAKKEDIEKMKKELEENTKRKVEKENQKLTQK